MYKKKILIFGRRRTGKSALCNTLSETNEFKDHFGHNTTSDHIKSIQFPYMELTMVDTSWLDANKIGEPDTLFRLLGTLYKLEEFHQILLVTSLRMNDLDVLIYNFLRSVLFDEDVEKYVTIVRNNFPFFRERIYCEIDKLFCMNNEMVSLTPINENLTSYQGRSVGSIIHVDSIDEHSRKDSRIKLLSHIQQCNHLYNIRKHHHYQRETTGQTVEEKYEKFVYSRLWKKSI